MVLNLLYTLTLRIEIVKGQNAETGNTKRGDKILRRNIIWEDNTIWGWIWERDRWGGR